MAEFRIQLLTQFRLLFKTPVKTKSKIQTIAAASIVVLCFILGLSKYSSGTGIDTKLETKDEFSYRVSLDKAWMEMSDEQKNAYNWAVEKYNLTQLLAKYPGITPRKVIKGEANERLAVQEKKLSELKSYLSANERQLAEAEAFAQEAKKELAKMESKSTGNERIIYNGSRFDLSFLEWVVRISTKALGDADVLENEECYRIPVNKPIKSGETITVRKNRSNSFSEVFSEETQCLLVMAALGDNLKDVKIEIDEKSVKDSSGNPIIPDVPTKSDYENAIANTLKEIEFLKKKKSVLG